MPRKRLFCLGVSNIRERDQAMMPASQSKSLIASLRWTASSSTLDFNCMSSAEGEGGSETVALPRTIADASEMRPYLWRSNLVIIIVRVLAASTPLTEKNAIMIKSTIRSTNVATIGLRSSPPGPMRSIGMKRRKRLRYGFVTSSTN